MNRLTLIVLFLSLFAICGAQSVETDQVFPELKWVKDVGAKSFPSKKKIYSVNKHGAINDGKTLNTVAIQKTIDECARKGGGIVTFDTGRYLTGSLYIREGVNFRLDKNVTILGSQDIKDYPEIDTRVAGVEIRWPSALINVLDQKNVAITGEGTVHAQGKPFWNKYWEMRREYEKKGLRWIVDYDCKRPRTLLVSRSSDVTVKGLTMKQAGFWTVQLLYSHNVSIDGLTILNNIDGSGPSTDGIDIDSSSWILVENCDIDCNDDDFCFKAGRDADGLRVNRPTEYVVIRKCIARRGAGLITFGSETSGNIRNVLAYGMTANGTTNCINFKSAVTRGGTVENIYVHDIDMNGVGTMVRATMDWNPTYSYSTLPEGYSQETLPAHWKVMLQQVPKEQGIPHFRNVWITNMKGTVRGSAVSVAGNQESPIENFNLKNVDVSSRSAGEISYAKGWMFDNVAIKASDNGEIRVKDSSVMSVALNTKQH